MANPIRTLKIQATLLRDASGSRTKFAPARSLAEMLLTLCNVPSEQADRHSIGQVAAQLNQFYKKNSGSRGDGYVAFGDAEIMDTSMINEQIQLAVSQIKAYSDKQVASFFAELEERSGPASKGFAKSFARVFIVHGHNQALRLSVEKVVSSQGLEPVVLMEQANRGQTVIEKFEKHSDVGYAIVLLTADDFGGKSGDQGAPRGRQNVIFELGYFCGKLGRDRVAFLLDPGLEEPSDISGICWIHCKEADWSAKLLGELQAAGYKIDASALLPK